MNGDFFWNIFEIFYPDSEQMVMQFALQSKHWCEKDSTREIDAMGTW